MLGTLLEKLLVSVGVDLSDLKEGMRDASREVKRISDDLKRDFEGVGQSWKDTGGKMVKAGAIMTGAVTAPLVFFGKQAAQASIDAEEMASAFHVTFGAMGSDMEAWAVKTGDAMGRSKQEIQRGAMAFQLLFAKAMDPKKAAEMSKQFAVLTQDLASFRNLSNEAAQQKLFAGLTGEAEPLRAVGVFLSETAVQSKLAALGIAKVNGDWTDQQKIIARAAIIREQLKDADGDVMRTADSTANRIRASQSAYEELSVTVGTILVPALAPLIGIVSDLLNGFNQLSPGTQSTIVTVLGLATAFGPVVTILGTVVSGIGALIPIIAGAIPIVTGFAGGFAGLLVAAAPVVAIVAAIAAAGYLIYQNWDTIGPMLEELWSTMQEVLGPPLQALVSAIVDAFGELWNGPLGEGIRAAASYLFEFQKAYGAVLGAAFIVILKAAIQFLTDLFRQIGDGIRLVSALLNGDWKGAWEAALSMVNRAMGGIPEVVGKMVTAVREWLVTKLNAIWGGVKTKIDEVKGWFFGLYDAVVGHSYIPDMVDGIGQNMAKLQSLMVDPAKAATTATKEAFRDLATNVSSLLDRLFPLQAQLRSVLADMALLEKARAGKQIDEATYYAAKDKLDMERREVQGEITPPAILKNLDPGPIVTKMMELGDIIATLPRVASEAEVALRDFGEQLGDGIMSSLRDVLTGKGSLKDVARNLLSGFFEKTITEALKSLETSIFGEGGLGGFLGTLFSSIFSAGGNRAVGGPVVPGRAYNIGTAEPFVASTHGRILSRQDAMDAMGGGGGRAFRFIVDKSDYFDAKVVEVTDPRTASAVGNYDRVAADRVNKGFRRRG